MAFTHSSVVNLSSGGNVTVRIFKILSSILHPTYRVKANKTNVAAVYSTITSQAQVLILKAHCQGNKAKLTISQSIK